MNLIGLTLDFSQRRDENGEITWDAPVLGQESVLAREFLDQSRWPMPLLRTLVTPAQVDASDAAAEAVDVHQLGLLKFDRVQRVVGRFARGWYDGKSKRARTPLGESSSKKRKVDEA